MIGKLSGRLDWRGTDHVLIDVRGVGYIVYISDRTMMGLPGLGEAVSLYTDLVVREDLLQLFGFPTMIEKEWHKLLTTVQGVGAKAAMAILGTLGPDGAARAITLGDQRAIQAAPGVGPKLAQRVILELKAKAGGLMAQGASLAVVATADDDVLEPVAVLPTKPVRNAGAIAPAAPSASQVRAGHAADALSALTNLGYAQGEAAQAVATVASEAPTSDTATLIRAALKLLAPKAK
jgi:Holliday junction DNA helicase RuvA